MQRKHALWFCCAAAAHKCGALWILAIRMFCVSVLFSQARIGAYDHHKRQRVTIRGCLSACLILRGHGQEGWAHVAIGDCGPRPCGTGPRAMAPGHLRERMVGWHTEDHGHAPLPPCLCMCMAAQTRTGCWPRTPRPASLCVNSWITPGSSRWAGGLLLGRVASSAGMQLVAGIAPQLAKRCPLKCHPDDARCCRNVGPVSSVCEVWCSGMAEGWDAMCPQSRRGGDFACAARMPPKQMRWGLACTARAGHACTRSCARQH